MSCVSQHDRKKLMSLALSSLLSSGSPVVYERIFGIFVNVTETTMVTSGKTVVTEVDNLWSEEYQSGFYESCKNVKNGASNGKAMDFIGGGAKNYKDFTKFLGDKKLLGSPFQIDFQTEPRNDQDGMEALPDQQWRAGTRKASRIQFRRGRPEVQRDSSGSQIPQRRPTKKHRRWAPSDCAPARLNAGDGTSNHN